MRRHAQMPWQLFLYLVSKLAWSLFIRPIFSRLTSCTEQNTYIKRRRRLGALSGRMSSGILASLPVEQCRLSIEDCQSSSWWSPVRKRAIQTKLNLPTYTEEHLGLDLMIINRHPCYVSVTEFLCVFEVKLLGMLHRPQRLIRAASRTMILFCAQINNVWRFGFMPSTWSHIY